jgi:hypothetical protein
MEALIMELDEIEKLAHRVRINVSKVIVGKNDVIDLAIVCLIASGHMLFEDVPGTAKNHLDAHSSVFNSLLTFYHRILLGLTFLIRKKINLHSVLVQFSQISYLLMK